MEEMLIRVSNIHVVTSNDFVHNNQCLLAVQEDGDENNTNLPFPFWFCTLEFSNSNYDS